ncbi:S8 family serine peptidase [Kribbella sp. NPDC051952]|uniref:S8 family peptidase n=1 Tax=Kribbella sp. NPDC051952 TaxID=3154851 RepID=UPI0034341335
MTGDAPSIVPGPGRQRMRFSATRVDGRLTVIPSDVRGLVDSGRLDRRLFDVTGLIDAGYDDAHTDSIPVIVTGSGAKAQPAGLTATRALPVIKSTAGKVAKKSAATFLSQLPSGRIWLDAKRHLLLDHSVPQIGAPAAWQAGYTGKGVRVAVVDSGIDKAHPDLASRVAEVKTFGDDLPGDQIGHGTHVASIIAGTGAASGGQYRGVAPDAELYDAKACTDIVCDDSAIIAALDWAARDVHAQVVNISLGFQDTPQDDPLEQAINTLTAETGTLFVVAAGNGGDHNVGINSPGSAAAALTVGAVDRDDAIAPFSSRGPVPGATTIKPDVTAPGVGIVAARSSEATTGEPVNDYYTRFSGTSMAAPHTVGAAALLLQQHPDWKAAELKSALTNSAKPGAGQGIFDQGAGRIDVARAITQSVLAGPSSIAFGTADWPHNDDKSVAQTLTYRNTSTEPVTLTLSTQFTDPTGAPAPAGALTTSTSQLTIPAGGSAPVQVTSATNHNGPDGRYSGQVVATWPGGTMHVPVTVLKDIEAYDLTVNMLRRDGTPAIGAQVSLAAVDGSTPQTFLLSSTGTEHLRLPPGDYTLDVDVSDQDDAAYAMVAPNIHLTANATVVLDARQARKVAIDVPAPDAQQSFVEADYIRTSPDGEHRYEQYFGAVGATELYTLGLGSTLPADQLTTMIASHWDGELAGTPYSYRPVEVVAGRFPTGLQRTVHDNELATVRTNLNRSTGDGYQLSASPSVDGHTILGMARALDAPGTLVQHLESGAVSWYQTVEETGPDDTVLTTLATTDGTSYRAGRSYQERWNAAARGIRDVSARRSGDQLEVDLARIADADGHGGYAAIDAGAARLYRNDVLVGESEDYGLVSAEGLPPEQATIRLETTATLPSNPAKIDYRATFRSQAGDAVTPLWTVGYQPIVNNLNVGTWTPTTKLPVLPSTPAGQSSHALKSVRVEVSGDGGKTWRAAQVQCVGERRYQATFATPHGAVSLRTTVTDAAGTTATQTTLGAYVVSGG